MNPYNQKGNKIYVFILYLFFMLLAGLYKISAFNLPLMGKVIYIDPGHGGLDPGSIYQNIYEKDINLEICAVLKTELEQQGAIVYMTRYGDYDLSYINTGARKRSDLNNRAKIINESNADMYISIHLNSVSSKTWHGAQVFYDDVKYSEDCIFNVNVLMKCNSFYYLNEPQYYNYYFNDKSITKSFRDDRWEVNKILIRRFEEDFGDEKRFDIPRQLWRKRLYCILNSLSERHHLESFVEKTKYCKEICNDSLTKETMKHLDGLIIPWKLRIILYLIKFRQAWLLALI